MSKKPTKKTTEVKPLAKMTVGEFERARKTILKEPNKDMKIPTYFEKIGFPEFTRLITE